MADYASFRQRLDAVLRTRDVKQVQDFLIAEGQWGPGTPANAEFAMCKVVSRSSPMATRTACARGVSSRRSGTRIDSRDRRVSQSSPRFLTGKRRCPPWATQASPLHSPPLPLQV